MSAKKKVLLKVIILGDSGWTDEVIEAFPFFQQTFLFCLRLLFFPPCSTFSFYRFVAKTCSQRGCLLDKHWHDRVGKTSLMNQYVNKKFTNQYKVPTLKRPNGMLFFLRMKGWHAVCLGRKNSSTKKISTEWWFLFYDMKALRVASLGMHWWTHSLWGHHWGWLSDERSHDRWQIGHHAGVFQG